MNNEWINFFIGLAGGVIIIFLFWANAVNTDLKQCKSVGFANLGNTIIECSIKEKKEGKV